MKDDSPAPLRPGVLRTPDGRFAALPGYPFAPRYTTTLASFEGLRAHYLDEGPTDAETTVLCLHGQPTWSYLYRKMVPVFVAAGQRVVAPDFFGFGRSDKPVDEAFYTFSHHRAMLVEFVRAMELRNVTLVVQDWGGLLGLTLPMDMPGVFSRLIVMNTALGTGDGPLGDGFLAWRAFSNSKPDMDVAALMRRSLPALSPKRPTPTPPRFRTLDTRRVCAAFRISSPTTLTPTVPRSRARLVSGGRRNGKGKHSWPLA